MMSEIKNLKELVYFADKKFGNEIFISEYINKTIRDKSFKQFRKDSDAIGAWIQKKFNSKVHIALIGTTSYEYLTAWFGIQCSCNVSVPLDASNTVTKLADEINRSDSEMVFVDKSHWNEIDELKKLCPAVRYYITIHKKDENTLSVDDIISKYKNMIPSGNPKENDLAAILFTSGTTGISKGVMLSNGNLIDNTVCEPDENFRGTKRLTVLPIHHVFCFTCDILCGLWYGRHICINDSLMRIPKNLKIFKPSNAAFVPMIASSLLARMNQTAEKNPNLSKREIAIELFGKDFEVIYSGGAYLSIDIVNGYKEYGIEITQGYGMTECSPRICTGKRNSEYPDSVGEIVPGCEVKIMNGEIWARSKSVMMGYYKNPEETAKTLTPDGWLKTGDLGYKNDKGYLYITGRKKNLIILSNGENVSPEEIENHFAMFQPIKEIIVYAKDNVITAEIYPNPEYVSNDIKAELQKKVDEVNSLFPPAKRIAKIVIRDKEFEKTTSKKIIRENFKCK